ncbi:MAG: DUF952 domain-containing protein [Anaerolineae bacterium]|nr:DUF952 domain-containing protein [Anaerolineae bacterium]
MTLILHITSRDAWLAAQRAGEYRGDTLETDGFIHCSDPDQVLGVANGFFAGQTGLVLLCIAAGKVGPEIRYEDLYDAGKRFPHIYGPLNLDAVTKVVDFPPQADGTFALPEGI